MITVLVCSRLEGNENSNLTKLLDTLGRFAGRLDDFEVIIKFDDDDPIAPEAVKQLKYPFVIKHCFGPRGRGYIDIHHGYCQAYKLANPRHTVVGAMADDFYAILPSWDLHILNTARAYSQDGIFLLHGRAHPWCDYTGYGNGRPFFQKHQMYYIRGNSSSPPDLGNYRQNKFFMDWKIEEMENLYIIDEAPFWGRGLIEVTGNFGPVSFTDAWTLALEHFLWNKHRVNRTVFTPKEFIYRTTNDNIDQPGAPRWFTDRKWNFDYIKSDEFRSIIERQVDDIVAKIGKG